MLTKWHTFYDLRDVLTINDVSAGTYELCILPQIHSVLKKRKAENKTHQIEQFVR